jgi:hypothetical protein
MTRDDIIAVFHRYRVHGDYRASTRETGQLYSVFRRLENAPAHQTTERAFGPASHGEARRQWEEIVADEILAIAQGEAGGR